MALLSRKPRTADRSDPAKLLILDHEKVERLFEDIEAADPAVPRQGLVAQLDSELSRHRTIEERIVYPFLRTNLDDGNELVDEATNEHSEARDALATVATLDPSSPSFLPQLERLKKLVSRHVKEEEGEIFPMMDEQVEFEALRGLRADLERAKLSETPSPTLPDERPRPTRGTTSTSTSRPGRSPSARTSRPGTRGPRASVRGQATAVWVQPHHADDGRWQVRREKASRASRVFDTQREAEQFGRRLARREKVEFVLTGRDGAVREKDSYGDDDRSRKG